jgi:hypothetical protein
MKIDENTQGSVANQEAVRLLRNWLSALFMADWFVCIVGGLYRGLSGTGMLTVVVKSLFFSYAIGIVLIIVAVRYLGRVIGVTKVYPVGMLRYFVVLGFLSVMMGLALVLGEAPAKPPEETSALLNSETEKWQAVKDAKVYCAKEGKQLLLQKLDRANYGATFICL